MKSGTATSALAGSRGVVAGDHLHGQRDVLDGAGERPAMVERVGERKHAAARHPAVGRLEADDAAIGGRPADRAARVGTHRHAQHAGGDRRAGARRRAAGENDRGSTDCAPAGTAGRSSGPPMANSWVASLPSSTAPPSRNFASTTQSACRHMVDQQLGMAGGADAGGLVDVLQPIRDAVHRALVDAGFELAVGPRGIGERALAGDERKAVQPRIERGDARQRVLRQAPSR